ncbi:MAG: NUDIX hydrolase [Firmicutes bacterium]|nr:NUDIX hydrolase [Bacillota bacterium]
MWIGGVRVILLDNENRLLMVKQSHKERDVWMVPGGGVEEGETSREAGVREMLEETGLKVKMGKLIWHVEEVSAERGQRFVNFFLAEPEGGTLQLGSDPELGEDCQVLRELRFMSREEINQLEGLYPEYLRDELWQVLEEKAGHDAFKIRK